MGFSRKYGCAGRAESRTAGAETARAESPPTAVPAPEAVADQLSAVLATALPSEHHRLASGHADTRLGSNGGAARRDIKNMARQIAAHTSGGQLCSHKRRQPTNAAAGRATASSAIAEIPCGGSSASCL